MRRTEEVVRAQRAGIARPRSHSRRDRGRFCACTPALCPTPATSQVGQGFRVPEGEEPEAESSEGMACTRSHSH